MSNWQTVKQLNGPQEWASRLIEGFQGATITASEYGGVDYFIPGPQDVGSGRCETQYIFGREGMTCAYEWHIWVPSSVEWSTTDDDENLISQHHGNKNAGFTGGTSVDATTEQIKIKVKGGHELNMSGSHRYDFEGEFNIGTLQRNKLHRIRHEVYWTRDDNGWYRGRLDDGPYNCLVNIPTWPIGDYDGVPTETIMWRTGFYPQRGQVPGDMRMSTGPQLFQIPA